tara:strand:- start:2157 stop:2615 length:459 start_codon:yes stop_codon:yes gene_type:complete
MIRVVIKEAESIRFRTHKQDDQSMLVMMIGFKGQDVPVGTFSLRPSKMIGGAIEFGELAIQEDQRGEDLEDLAWKQALSLAKQAGYSSMTPMFSNNNAQMTDVEKRMWQSNNAKKIDPAEMARLLKNAQSEYAYQGDVKWWVKKGLNMQVTF